MRILKKIAIGLLIFLVVLGIAGFFIAPPLMKPYIMKKMSEALHRKASIEKISINPYAVSITLKKFSLEDPGKPKPFVAFDELYVNADLMSSLFRRALILKQITLTNPSSEFPAIRRFLNFSDLLPKEEQNGQRRTTFSFSLNTFR
jgi:uncharacterized protein involved in outer membrane biogenesis